ncbi:hypothetical protein [Rhodococcus sp. Q]|uniref:hypothetical protein n=1 Tax=Rhodococcus sp. Q TaxID=2502252 RepID=UPI0010F8B66F|nr:hypothetical protein [Rhodococcus sp. Q]
MRHYLGEGVYEASGSTDPTYNCNWLLFENRPNTMPQVVRSGRPLVGGSEPLIGPFTVPVYRTAETMRDPSGQIYTSFQTNPACGTWTYTPAAATITTDGEYVIGAAIKTGTYATIGAASNEAPCTYRKVVPGTTNTGQWATTTRKSTIQITDLDRGGSFETKGCAAWTLDDDTTPTPGTGSAGGTFFGS